MKEKTIGLLDESYINSSIQETEYLAFIENNVGYSIERQKKIGAYWVDGYDARTNTVYEYNGCLWHGCKWCKHSDIVFQQKTMKMRLQKTLRKAEDLRKMGYHLITMWEHKWVSMKKKDPVVKAFVNSGRADLRCPSMKMREAFFGGRTEVFDMYAKAEGDKEIGYADVTSLYPYINAMRKYPVGHPTRTRDEKEFLPLNELFGYQYCKIQTNKDLRIPVLPEKTTGKLTFSHGIKVGIWCSEELKKAVEYGYEILEVYEQIHWKENTMDLFKNYIQTFFKIKSECSYDEEVCGTKDEYVAELREAEFSVCLDKDKLEYNPGMRFISKLCLNTLWGKFGQRSNMTQTEICKDPTSYFKLIFDDTIQVSNINFLNDDTVEIKYKQAHGFEKDSKNTNVAIAGFTTSYARLKLFECMEVAGFDNIHYCDTDSIIYNYTRGKNPIKMDNMLGGLTDELDGKGYIEELICLAPKTYAYKLNNGDVKLKAKGFMMTAQACEKISFSGMKEMIMELQDTKQQDQVSQHCITYDVMRTDHKDKHIYNRQETKTFKLGFDKREISWSNSTENRITTTPLYI